MQRYSCTTWPAHQADVHQTVGSVTTWLGNGSTNYSSYGSGPLVVHVSPTSKNLTVKVTWAGSNYGSSTTLFSVDSMGYQTITYTRVFAYRLVRTDVTLPDRYEFGYNGKYKDNEIAGMGNSLDFGARTFNPRIARWNSSDPHFSKYTPQSPYGFVGNSPILTVESNNPLYRQLHTYYYEHANLPSEEVARSDAFPIPRWRNHFYLDKLEGKLFGVQCPISNDTVGKPSINLSNK